MCMIIFGTEREWNLVIKDDDIVNSKQVRRDTHVKPNCTASLP